MKHLNIETSEQELEDMINEIDADGNKQVDFTELLALMARTMTAGDGEDEVKEAFRVFDKVFDQILSRRSNYIALRVHINEYLKIHFSCG